MIIMISPIIQALAPSVFLQGCCTFTELVSPVLFMVDFIIANQYAKIAPIKTDSEPWLQRNRSCTAESAYS